MSRALPGGMLNSKEKTEYEDWLEELHKKIDKNKDKKDTCSMPLMDKDAGANGCHNYDGSLMTDKNRVHGVFEAIYSDCYKGSLKKGSKKVKESISDTNKAFNENVYYSSLGLGALWELYESLCELNNFKQRFQEGSSLGTPEKEEQRFNFLLEKATDKINGIVDRTSINNDNLLQDRFEAAEELIVRVVEQQYKMASDAKTQDYGDIVKKCGDSLQRLIQKRLKEICVNNNVSLVHINGKPVESNDFNIGFYMKLASEKVGINFKTLLVA